MTRRKTDSRLHVADIDGAWLQDEALQVCVVQIEPPELASIEGDQSRVKVVATLGDLLDGARPALRDLAPGGPPALVLLPEYSLGSPDWPGVDRLVRMYPTPLILVAGFGATRGSVLREWREAGGKAVETARMFGWPEDYDLALDRRYNGAWCWVHMQNGRTSCYVSLKNFFEQRVEPGVLPDLAEGHHTLCLQGSDLVLIPLICADLVCERGKAAEDPLARIRRQSGRLTRGGRKLLITGLLHQSNPDHELFHNSIDRACGIGKKGTVVVALANAAMGTRDNGVRWLWRSLSGVYASGSLQHDCAELPPVQVVRNRKFTGVVVDSTDPVVVSGPIRWEFGPTQGRYLWQAGVGRGVGPNGALVPGVPSGLEEEPPDADEAGAAGSEGLLTKATDDAEIAHRAVVARMTEDELISEVARAVAEHGREGGEDFGSPPREPVSMEIPSIGQWGSLPEKERTREAYILGARLHSYWGKRFGDVGDWGRSFFYHSCALSIWSKSGDRGWIARAYGRLAWCMITEGRFRAARSYLATGAKRDSLQGAANYFWAAQYCFRAGAYEEAKSMLAHFARLAIETDAVVPAEVLELPAGQRAVPFACSFYQYLVDTVHVGPMGSLTNTDRGRLHLLRARLPSADRLRELKAAENYFARNGLFSYANFCRGERLVEDIPAGTSVSNRMRMLEKAIQSYQAIRQRLTWMEDVAQAAAAAASAERLVAEAQSSVVSDRVQDALEALSSADLKLRDALVEFGSVPDIVADIQGTVVTTAYQVRERVEETSALFETVYSRFRDYHRELPGLDGPYADALEAVVDKLLGLQNGDPETRGDDH